MAVAEASFKTSSDDMSLGFKVVKGLPTPTTPSTTYNGSLLELIEFVPRIRIIGWLPGTPAPFEITCTPATLFSKACPRFATGLSISLLDEILVTAPVRSFFFAVPYPITTTSFNPIFSSSRVMLISVLFPASLSDFEIPHWKFQVQYFY